MESRDDKYWNKKKRATLRVAFLGGALSGTCSTLLLQPFDVIKTRIQEASVLNSKLTKPGMFNTVTKIVQTEGALSLWAGLVPSLWRCVPGVALYFTTLETLKLLARTDDRTTNTQPGLVQAFVIGASARCFATTVLMPFTVVKTRFESGSHKYSSTIQGLRSIYRVEGLTGLMSGTVATLARDVPFSAVYYAAYSQAQKFTNKGSVLGDSVCGLFAGCLATVVTHPADVVKTRLQLFPDQFHNGSLSVIRSVYSAFGLAGFFIGMAPRLLRRTLVAALSWTLYEQVKRSVKIS